MALNINKRRVGRGAAGASALVLAIMAYTTPWEGERTTAYKDIVGVATICMGETQGVKMGMKVTHEQCLDMFADRVPDYLDKVEALIPGLPNNRKISYTDFSWNLGVASLTQRTTRPDPRFPNDKTKRIEIPGTSIVDLEKAGKWQQACERMSQFVYAGGKVIPQLVRRRASGVKLCLTGSADI